MVLNSRVVSSPEGTDCAPHLRHSPSRGSHVELRKLLEYAVTSLLLTLFKYVEAASRWTVVSSEVSARMSSKFFIIRVSNRRHRPVKMMLKGASRPAAGEVQTDALPAAGDALRLLRREMRLPGRQRETAFPSSRKPCCVLLWSLWMPNLAKSRKKTSALLQCLLLPVHAGEMLTRCHRVKSRSRDSRGGANQSVVCPLFTQAYKKRQTFP